MLRVLARTLVSTLNGYWQLIRAHPAFLGFGFLVTFSSTFGQSFFIGLYREPLLDAFGLADDEFAALYSAATFCSGLTILWVGRLIDDIELRRYSLAVAITAVLACTAFGLVQAAWMLVVVIYFMRLSCQGLMGHIASTTMSRYFDADRGKALSVSGLGYPVGEAIFPIIAVAVIGAVGWRNSWFFNAGAVALLLIPPILILLRDHGDRHAQFLKEHEDRSAAHAAKQAEQPSMSARARRRQIGHQWTRREVLRDPRFYFIIPTVLTPPFVGTAMLFFGTKWVEMKDWADEGWAIAFTAFAAAQVVTGILSGPLIDRFGAIRLVPGILIPEALAVIILAWGDAPATMFAFMILLGITGGVASNVIGAMWAEMYGVLHLGSIRALASSLMVFSTSASPYLMGRAIREGATLWQIAAAVSIGIAIVTALSFIGTRMHVRHSIELS